MNPISPKFFRPPPPGFDAQRRHVCCSSLSASFFVSFAQLPVDSVFDDLRTHVVAPAVKVVCRVDGWEGTDTTQPLPGSPPSVVVVVGGGG